MSKLKKEKKGMKDVEELKEVLSVVSDKIPALIKGLVSSVFSQESAAEMGKAAATFYKELKAGGLPDDVAVKMTQDYVATFTKVSDFMKSASHAGEHDVMTPSQGLQEIKRAVSEKLKEKLGADEE